MIQAHVSRMKLLVMPFLQMTEGILIGSWMSWWPGVFGNTKASFGLIKAMTDIYCSFPHFCHHVRCDNVDGFFVLLCFLPTLVFFFMMGLLFFNSVRRSSIIWFSLGLSFGFFSVFLDVPR